MSGRAGRRLVWSGLRRETGEAGGDKEIEISDGMDRGEWWSTYVHPSPSRIGLLSRSLASPVHKEGFKTVRTSVSSIAPRSTEEPRLMEEEGEGGDEGGGGGVGGGGGGGGGGCAPLARCAASLSRSLLACRFRFLC